MLPLRDDIPASRFPAATLGIIVINILIFFHELKLGPNLEDLLVNFAIIPARYTVPDVAQLFSFSQQVFSFFSSMFLHGGWIDRKSTRLNSSHLVISYAVFCLK